MVLFVLKKVSGGKHEDTGSNNDSDESVYKPASQNGAQKCKYCRIESTIAKDAYPSYQRRFPKFVFLCH
jgi:hypothetical protein